MPSPPVGGALCGPSAQPIERGRPGRLCRAGFTSTPWRASYSDAAYVRYGAGVQDLRVTAAYQGTAGSFLGWVGTATFDAGTASIVASEGDDPMSVCYLSGMSFPLPNIPGAPPFTNIVSIQDEKTGWGVLLVGGHNDSWSFNPPASAAGSMLPPRGAGRPRSSSCTGPSKPSLTGRVDGNLGDRLGVGSDHDVCPRCRRGRQIGRQFVDSRGHAEGV